MPSKKELESIINEELADMPNISANDVKGKYDLIQEIRKEIQDTECHLTELNISLRYAIEEYNAALAMNLRKRVPGLAVSLSNGRCSAGYRSTALSCRPDVENGIWQFDPTSHGRRFSRRNGHLLKLGNQIEPLVDAIVDYFSRYRSLNV